MLAALGDDPLPFEHRALDVLWQKMVTIIICLPPLVLGLNNSTFHNYVFILGRGSREFIIV